MNADGDIRISARAHKQHRIISNKRNKTKRIALSARIISNGLKAASNGLSATDYQQQAKQQQTDQPIKAKDPHIKQNKKQTS